MLLFHAMSICSMRSLVYPFLPCYHPHISHTSRVCQVFFSFVQGHHTRPYVAVRSNLRPQGIFHVDLLQCVGATETGHTMTECTKGGEGAWPMSSGHRGVWPIFWETSLRAVFFVRRYVYRMTSRT